MKTIENPARKRLRRLQKAISIAAREGKSDAKAALCAFLRETEAALQRKRRTA